MVSDRIKKIKLINEFYFFRIVLQISTYFMFTFYLVLLYKETNDFKILIIDSVIFYVGLWVGFVFGSFALQRIGYVNTFRLSFIIMALAGIAIALSIPQIALLFPILSLFRGFGRGIFWPVNHTYTVREFNETERGSIISIITSTSLILDIAFPLLVGSLLSYTGDYTLIYIIGSGILITASLLKFGYNKKPTTSITSGEITSILKNKIFAKYAVLTIFNEMTGVILLFIQMILPFIITKNEGEAGAILSIINLVAAVVAYSQRKQKVRKGLGMGKYGYIFGLLASIILIFSWNIIGITISLVFVIISSALRSPLEEKLVIYIKEIMLDRQRNQSTIELNLVIETLYLIGRLIGFVIFLGFFNTFTDYEGIFKVFILIAAIWSIINIFFLVKIAKRNKKELSDLNLPPSPSELPV
ncbi:MAG: MFS transporter [Candidatus Dojkabacteria bacterium]